MKTIIDIFVSTFSQLQICIIALLLLIFLLLISIYIVQFLRVAFSNRTDSDQTCCDISVVVVAKNDIEFLLKKVYYLINQKFDANYQIVIVDNRSDDEIFLEELARLSEKYPELIYVTHVPSERHKSTKKLACTLGVKGAKYERVLLLSSHAVVDNPNWLATIAPKFNSYNIVTIYSRVAKDVSCKRARARNVIQSLLYMSRINNNSTYMVNEFAYGFTRTMFFNNGGYGVNLRLNRGENDLFIQTLSRRERRVGLVLEPNATIEIERESIKKDFLFEEAFTTYTRRFYSVANKLYIALYQLLNLLFAILLVVAAVLLYPLSVVYTIASLALLVTIKIVMQILLYNKLSKRTKEKIPYFYMFYYDLVAPFEELLLLFRNRVNPRKDIWI